MRAVNLIPEDQRGGGALVGAGRSQGTAYAVVALLAGLAVLAFLYGSARHQISDRTTQAASISAEVTQIQSEAERLQPYASFIALRDERMEAVDNLVAARFDWPHEFHELGRVLPKGVWLTSITGTVGGATGAATSSSSTATSAGATPTSSTPAGSIPTFDLSGCAATQSQVALTLDRLHLMDGVSAVSLDSSGSAAQGAAGTPGASGADCKTSFTTQLTFEALPSTSTVTSAASTSKASGRNVADTGTTPAASTAATASGSAR